MICRTWCVLQCHVVMPSSNSTSVSWAHQFIDWLTDWHSVWFSEWLTVRLTNCDCGWLWDLLNDWLCLYDWLSVSEWLTVSDWLNDWLYLTSRLTDWMTDCVWLTSRLTEWLADWPIDYLCDCVTIHRQKAFEDIPSLFIFLSPYTLVMFHLFTLSFDHKLRFMENLFITTKFLKKNFTWIETQIWDWYKIRERA